MNRNSIRKTIAAPAIALLLTVWCVQAQAQGKAQDMARDTVEQVLRKAKEAYGNELDAWSRSAIRRALEKAGKNAPRASGPLPAERHAGRVARGLSTAAPRPRGHRVHEPLGAPGELAAMEPGGRADRGAAGAARVRPGRVPGHREAHRPLPGPDSPGPPSIRACSGSSASRRSRPWPWSRAGSRPARAGAAQRIPRRPTTASRGTSAWKRPLRPSPKREGRAGRRPAAISRA